MGKIYNLLSDEIAAHIYREVAGIREVTVWLCSQIGKPIDRPLIAEAQLILEPEALFEDIRGFVVAVIDRELDGIPFFTQLSCLVARQAPVIMRQFEFILFV